MPAVQAGYRHCAPENALLVILVFLLPTYLLSPLVLYRDEMWIQVAWKVEIVRILKSQQIADLKKLLAWRCVQRVLKTANTNNEGRIKSHLETQANGQAVVFLKGLLKVLISEISFCQSIEQLCPLSSHQESKSFMIADYDCPWSYVFIHRFKGEYILPLKLCLNPSFQRF